MSSRLGKALLVVAALSFFLGPFAWQLVTSLTPEAELLSAQLPTRLTVASYEAVLRLRGFGRVLGNSLLVAGLTTVVCLGLGTPAAFALAKLRFWGRDFVLGVALAISMFPPIATVSPLYLMLGALGLRDTVGGLVLPYTTFALPLTLWLMTSFFRDLPDALLHCARLDGCTPLQALWRVFLPLSTPALATTAILVFVFSWNEFMYALTFVSSPAHRTIPVELSLFAGEHVEPWGEIAAASVVATLPLAVLTLLFQRRIVSGLTAGAVKG